MSKPKKDQSLFTTDSLNEKLCLNCGFPNRESDSHCIYCKNAFFREGDFISWVKNTYYIFCWRWEVKQRKNPMESFSKSLIPNLKILGYFFIGVMLSTAGLYLFSDALAASSFSSGIIASLFLCYGIITLKSVFVKK
tara:strand:- start:1 stop:411 length:411 start_codon:yes stop_codon:yes gene_type:complete